VMQWKQLLAGLEENPGRIDLASGVICLCRTIQNPVEQAGLLTACSALILKAQPLVALQMLRLALILAPRHPLALTYARDIFKRRGRWAAEQRVTELLATLTHATAVSPPPDAVSNMTTQTRANQMGGGAAHDTVESPMVAQPFTPLQNGRSGIAADLFADEPIRFDPEEFNPPPFQPEPEHHDQSPNVSFDTKPFEVERFEPLEVDPQRFEQPQKGRVSFDIAPVEASKIDTSSIENVTFEIDLSQVVEASVDDKQRRAPDAVPPELKLSMIDRQEEVNFFAEFLKRCDFDSDWLKFSTGFTNNVAGLVAFVNLLFTMRVVDEQDRSKATITLYRMIKESENHTDAESLFERLFMQRSARGDD